MLLASPGVAVGRPKGRGPAPTATSNAATRADHRRSPPSWPSSGRGRAVDPAPRVVATSAASAAPRELTNRRHVPAHAALAAASHRGATVLAVGDVPISTSAWAQATKGRPAGRSRRLRTMSTASSLHIDNRPSQPPQRRRPALTRLRFGADSRGDVARSHEPVVSSRSRSHPRRLPRRHPTVSTTRPRPTRARGRAHQGRVPSPCPRRPTRLGTGQAVPSRVDPAATRAGGHGGRHGPARTTCPPRARTRPPPRWRRALRAVGLSPSSVPDLPGTSGR